MPLPDFLPGRFALSRGRPSDYFALEHFHYLPKRPATYANVWVVRYENDDSLSREAPPLHGVVRGAALHFGDHDAMDSRWRCASRLDTASDTTSRVVAVGVLSFPTLRSTPRERTLGLRDRTARERITFVNAHVRTVSRVVVHPQFRGLGLSSELVRKLIDICPTRYVEASAVMAHVHPFFAAAGMRRVPFDAAQCTEDERSRHDDETRPAYFIFDKETL